jgi:hypothetical protein
MGHKRAKGRRETSGPFAIPGYPDHQPTHTSITRSTAMPDFVRVTNEDTKPFIYHYNNSKKTIPPGRDMMMPWGLACSLFGDPFLQDAPKKPDRTDALRRARGNFNYELGMETMDVFMSRIPKLRIFDMESMQEMHMLLFDPEGQMHANYVAPDVDSTDPVTLLTQQVAMLTTQLQMVLAAQAGQAAPAAGNTLPMVTTDTGPTIPGQPMPTSGAEWVGGNPFAQREADQGPPMFDFAAISTGDPNGPVPDGMPIDPTNTTPNDLIAQAQVPASVTLPEDAPQDVGVGSGDAKLKLAPRTKSK